MINRVLEVCEENRYLSLDRGFLVVKAGDEKLGEVPLDDIGTLLISAQSAVLTKNILNALAENGCITILCGKNYAPVSMILPFSAHYQTAKIIKLQINVSEPFRKKIWQQIIKQKIENQAYCLKLLGKEEDAALIDKISLLVKSGDTDNREAYAAKMYWKSLFGEDFKRNRNEPGINSLLNYGYAVIRSAMARAVCAKGLLPALGVHHDNSLNEFCLVDDFMEVYRPIVDLLVYKLVEEENNFDVTPDKKKTLAKSLLVMVVSEEGKTPVFQSMHYMADSYVKSLEYGKPMVKIPEWKGNNNGITIIE